MVRIRFRRVGARNQASFRIVAADKESPRDGRFLEVLGMYNPRTNPSTVKVDEARLFHWMSHGAQPSDSVTQTLRSLGTWERWERFKGGESLDTLIPEAEASTPEVDPRTRRDDLIGQRSTKRRRHPDAEPSPEDPKAEAEAEVAAPSETEPAKAEAEAPESNVAEEETAEGESEGGAGASEGELDEAEAEESEPAEDEADAENAEESKSAADEADAEDMENAEQAADEADAKDAEGADPAADEPAEAEGE